ncbi:hypothetical protein [Flavobacterium seoulense]|uniref:Uncharacterized protein n=1 Tax=Flavobacterium seoulense TaxID=1492738 RepID=A0A066WQ93_9FLAO|nr:hypothetical protein [Flavobacterium seoulense]KDN55996.1 hypothetical protein FEM21_08950 [Flavobacterium seoulense]
MFYHINEIIDLNLELLFLSKNHSLKFSEFKDKDGKKLGKITEFFQLMEKKNLIKIEHNKCNLTEFGKKIAENGGWFEHLKKKKENEKTNLEETESFLKDQTSFSLFTNRLQNIFKKTKA